MSDAAWAALAGIAGWCVVAGIVVWWIDRKMRQAPPDPNDVETELRRNGDERDGE